MIDIGFQATSAAPDVDHWLATVGFEFNPFAFLDASSDPRISAYLVGHGAFAAMWGHWPAMAFAPAGGGKTALRMQVARACWAGPDRGYPFPVSYLPSTMDGKLPTTLDVHLQAILQAATLSLFQAFSIRPHWWDALDGNARRTVRGLFDCALPISLSHHLAQVQDALFSAPQTDFGRHYSGTNVDLPRWALVLGQLVKTSSAAISVSPLDRLQTLVDLILGPLGLSAVYLLVDGIDGFPETADSPSASSSLLAPLMANAHLWSEKGVFLKGFLPVETAATLTGSVSFKQPIHQVSIVWSPQLLAEVLRQRIYVATSGEFSSLDAVSAPSFRDIETRIARSAKPLPREALVLVSRLIWEHIRRSGDSSQLNEGDLQVAVKWYDEASAALKASF